MASAPPPPEPAGLPPPSTSANAQAALSANAQAALAEVIDTQRSVLLRLRAARAALDKGDDSAAAVRAATQEIARNAALLNDARADLEDVFKRARGLRRRLEASFPPPPPTEAGDVAPGGSASGA